MEIHQNLLVVQQFELLNLPLLQYLFVRAFQTYLKVVALTHPLQGYQNQPK